MDRDPGIVSPTYRDTFWHVREAYLTLHCNIDNIVESHSPAITASMVLLLSGLIIK